MATSGIALWGFSAAGLTVFGFVFVFALAASSALSFLASLGLSFLLNWRLVGRQILLAQILWGRIEKHLLCLGFLFFRLLWFSEFALSDSLFSFFGIDVTAGNWFTRATYEEFHCRQPKAPSRVHAG